MILCAGFGTRLKPLTEITPKPLLPIFDLPILDLIIKQFLDRGLNDIAINTHHLPKCFSEHFSFLKNQEDPKFKLFISEETPNVLGSGGAFAPITKWRNGHDLIVVNGDIISDISTEKLIEEHELSKACVTFSVLTKPLDRDKAILIDGDFNVKKISSERFPELTAHANAGFYIYSDRFFKYLPTSGSASVLDGFEKALKNNEIMRAVIHTGFWASVDSREMYQDVHKKLLIEHPQSLAKHLKIAPSHIHPMVFPAEN